MSQVPSPEDAVFEDPLEHLVCMECAGVQDEDLILLCDGATPLCCVFKMHSGPNHPPAPSVLLPVFSHSLLGASDMLPPRQNGGSWAAGCNQGCHTYCARPPLDGVPAGAWYCAVCAPTLASHPRRRAPRSRGQRAASPDVVSTMLIFVCKCLPCRGRALLASVELISFCHAPAVGKPRTGALSEGLGSAFRTGLSSPLSWL